MKTPKRFPIVSTAVAATTLWLLGAWFFPSPISAATPDPKAGGTATRLNDDALDVSVIGYEGDRAVLKVRNRTPFLVVLYIKGVRVGWLKPSKTGVMRGLRAGYHRVYAHSRWGSSYWGPRRVWVPGHWNLHR